MGRGRVVALVVLAVAGGLVALFAVVNAQDPPMEELARRCAASRPAWNGYQEDIKEIGARPIARWRGEPVSASVRGDRVIVTFRLEPPWDAWEAAVPLLLRDPEGAVIRDSAHQREGNLRHYTFIRENAVDAATLPWVEIQYPHTRKRFHFSGGSATAARSETTAPPAGSQ